MFCLPEVIFISGFLKLLDKALTWSEVWILKFWLTLCLHGS